MRNVFKRSVSLVLVLCVLFLGALAPAYANELNGSGVVSSGTQVNIGGHHNRTTINNYPRDSYGGSQGSSVFLDSVANGAISTVGFALGATAICFGADALATSVFPPAAFLAPYCPGIGTAIGGGKIITQGAQTFAR
jgi:hypothetical protein